MAPIWIYWEALRNFVFRFPYMLIHVLSAWLWIGTIAQYVDLKRHALLSSSWFSDYGQRKRCLYIYLSVSINKSIRYK